jgi:hypothetical protein
MKKAQQKDEFAEPDVSVKASTSEYCERLFQIYVILRTAFSFSAAIILDHAMSRSLILRNNNHRPVGRMKNNENVG